MEISRLVTCIHTYIQTCEYSARILWSVNGIRNYNYILEKVIYYIRLNVYNLMRKASWIWFLLCGKEQLNLYCFCPILFFVTFRFPEYLKSSIFQFINILSTPCKFLYKKVILRRVIRRTLWATKFNFSPNANFIIALLGMLQWKVNTKGYTFIPKALGPPDLHCQLYQEERLVLYL